MDLQLSRRESFAMLLGWRSKPAPPNQPRADHRMRTWRSTAETFSGVTSKFPGARLRLRPVRRLASPPHSATRYHPTALIIVSRETTVCGGYIGEINATVRLQVGYTWFGFWMPLDRSSFCFLRRAARLQLELAVRGCSVSASTRSWRVCLHGRSNVTWIDLEAQPSIATFFASPRRSIVCSFLWVLGFGGFLLWFSFDVS